MPSPTRGKSSAPGEPSSSSRLSNKLHSGFVSLEFFPPKTEDGTGNLLKRINHFVRLGPLYVDVTSAPRNRALALQICVDVLKYCGVDVLLHVTCAEWSKDELRATLEEARKRGVRNVMALRGDVAENAGPRAAGAFATAHQLVAFIREEFGNAFCIAVAGYPEGALGLGRHSPEYQQDLRALKAKVDAGAEFCVTQLFFDVDLFFAFVQDCRAMDIHVPIIPGIMPIQLYKVFSRTTSYLKTRVPEPVLGRLEPIKHDDALVRAYGIELGAAMCADLLRGGAPGVHFFTLNLERSVSCIVQALQEQGLVEQKKSQFPWKQSAHEKRAGEDVRPIFWSNKPKSYVNRTQEWDEFPNGRWGDASSPAYGELNGSHYYHSVFGSVLDRRVAWGAAPLTVQDLADVFVGYVNGAVPFLPWSESGLALETGFIRDVLVQLNRNGFLTINSQPCVNGAKSSDKALGWGPANGYVYQKAYVEFFVCERGARVLANAIDQHWPSLSYMALNHRGEELRNRPGQGAMAVTWGVFPGRAVIQPTVADPVSFVAWKQEAFDLWTAAWAAIYPEHSPSHALIWDVHDSFFLMHIVDDEFVSGNVWDVFQREEVVAAAREGLVMTGVL
jgi:methylenetetrahydrofolate reductase (NADPH)